MEDFREQRWRRFMNVVKRDMQVVGVNEEDTVSDQSGRFRVAPPKGSI